jgi:hypothetical protein
MKKNWNKEKDKFNKKLNNIFFCDSFKIYIYIYWNWNSFKNVGVPGTPRIYIDNIFEIEILFVCCCLWSHNNI